MGFVSESDVFSATVEITKAALSGVSYPLDEKTGEKTSAFIQTVYNKLKELADTHFDRDINVQLVD